MNDLLLNIDKIHTTEMGIIRIKNNLKSDISDVVEYCKELIRNKDSIIYQKGKNWYCKVNNILITNNSNSYTIITAYLLKR